MFPKFSGKGGRYANDDCLSPVPFVNSGDTHSDLPKTAELHCCDLFDSRRTIRLDSLALSKVVDEQVVGACLHIMMNEGGAT